MYLLSSQSVLYGFTEVCVFNERLYDMSLISPVDHITSDSASFETVLSLLSSFFLPEDENVLLSWIEKAIADQKLRASMQGWRVEWKRLVADGKSGSALL